MCATLILYLNYIKKDSLLTKNKNGYYRQVSANWSAMLLLALHVKGIVKHRS